MFPFPTPLLTVAAQSSGSLTGTPPTFVGATSASVSISTDTTISLTGLTGGSDSAPQTGDLVIVCFNRAAGSGQNRPPSVTTSGYTETVGPIFYGPSGAVNLGIFTKFMGGTPDTNVIVGPQASTLMNGDVVVHVWRGVNTTTPFDVTSTTNEGAGNCHSDAPAITPTTIGSVILIVNSASLGNSTLTALTQVGSEQSNFRSSFSTRSSASAAVAVGSVNWSGSGAFDPTALTGGSSSSGCWVGVSMALRPSDAH